MSEKHLHECVVLHVEDDDASAYLFQLALREADLNPRVFRASDAKQANAFLQGDPPYENAPRPDLMLLDLNLPGENGFNVLTRVKSIRELNSIHVVVFTSSTSHVDESRAMQLGADAYLSKGVNFEAFAEAAEVVCEKATSERLRKELN